MVVSRKKLFSGVSLSTLAHLRLKEWLRGGQQMYKRLHGELQMYKRLRGELQMYKRLRWGAEDV